MQLTKLSIRHVELISLLVHSALKVGSLLLPVLLLWKVARFRGWQNRTNIVEAHAYNERRQYARRWDRALSCCACQYLGRKGIFERRHLLLLLFNHTPQSKELICHGFGIAGVAKAHSVRRGDRLANVPVRQTLKRR